MKSAWKFSFLAAVVMAGVSLQVAQAQTVNTTAGPTFGVNDYNQLQSFTPNTNYASPCPWVTAGFNTWVAAGGGGSSPTVVWNLNWASNTAPVAYTASLSAMSITEYNGTTGAPLTSVAGGTVGGANTAQGWVTSRPSTNIPGGYNYPAIAGPADAGGDVAYIKYAPTMAQITAGAPTAASVMFLQAYSLTSSLPITVDGNTWNGANSQLLDNGALPWNTARNQATPWYGAGTLGGQGAGVAAMADAPVAVAPNPLTGGLDYNDQFQTFIATDTVTVAGPVTTNNVTVYGGVSWGFDYTAAVPEPGSVTLCAAGLFLFSGYGWRRARRKRKQAA